LYVDGGGHWIGNVSVAGAILQRDGGDVVIVEHSDLEYLHEKADHSLCTICGLLRMADDEMDDTPRDVVTALISQVRQDIGRINQEHRDAFQTIDRRLIAICEDVDQLKLDQREAMGKRAGAKDVIGYLIALAGMTGAAVAWIIAHLPWTQSKP
jgi:hypothetical protein